MSKRPQIGHNLRQNAVLLDLQKLLEKLNDRARLQGQNSGAELRILKLKTHLLQALFQRGLHALELKLAQLFRTEHTVRTILAGTVEKLAKLQRRLHTLQRPLSQLGQNVKGDFGHLIPELALINFRILTSSLLPCLGKLHSAVKLAQFHKSRQLLRALTQITHRVETVTQRIRESILQQTPTEGALKALLGQANDGGAQRERVVAGKSERARGIRQTRQGRIELQRPAQLQPRYPDGLFQLGGKHRAVSLGSLLEAVQRRHLRTLQRLQVHDRTHEIVLKNIDLLQARTLIQRNMILLRTDQQMLRHTANRRQRKDFILRFTDRKHHGVAAALRVL